MDLKPRNINITFHYALLYFIISIYLLDNEYFYICLFDNKKNIFIKFCIDAWIVNIDYLYYIEESYL
jgi:hypothetical protein